VEGLNNFPIAADMVNDLFVCLCVCIAITRRRYYKGGRCVPAMRCSRCVAASSRLGDQIAFRSLRSRIEPVQVLVPVQAVRTIYYCPILSVRPSIHPFDWMTEEWINQSSIDFNPPFPFTEVTTT
jgi:hypothetical protein